LDSPAGEGIHPYWPGDGGGIGCVQPDIFLYNAEVGLSQF
jgi:hypothetical protein